MDHLRTAKARQLYETMRAAEQELKNASAEYQGILGTAWDTAGNADGMLALRRQGKLYADASLKYSHSLMAAWLAYVETATRSGEGGAG